LTRRGQGRPRRRRRPGHAVRELRRVMVATMTAAVPHLDLKAPREPRAMPLPMASTADVLDGQDFRNRSGGTRPSATGLDARDSACPRVRFRSRCTARPPRSRGTVQNSTTDKSPIQLPCAQPPSWRVAAQPVPGGSRKLAALMPVRAAATQIAAATTNPSGFRRLPRVVDRVGSPNAAHPVNSLRKHMSPAIAIDRLIVPRPLLIGGAKRRMVAG